jgi:hypothetical protein
MKRAGTTVAWVFSAFREQIGWGGLPTRVDVALNAFRQTCLRRRHIENPPQARPTRRMATVGAEISRVWNANLHVYGPDKI